MPFGRKKESARLTTKTHLSRVQKLEAKIKTLKAQKERSTNTQTRAEYNHKIEEAYKELQEEQEAAIRRKKEADDRFKRIHK